MGSTERVVLDSCELRMSEVPLRDSTLYHVVFACLYVSAIFGRQRSSARLNVILLGSDYQQP